MATLGIVGLGLLGSAVAGRLRAGGHDVVGYDLVAEKAKSLVELGGRGAPRAEGGAKWTGGGGGGFPVAWSVGRGGARPPGLGGARPCGGADNPMDSSLSPPHR